MATRSLFIRPMLGNLNQITNTHYVSLSASNIMGLGGGLVLELKPVPPGKTRGYNVLWVSKLTPLDEHFVLKADVYQKREEGTEPFYVVSRKVNKSLLKRLEKMAKLMEDPDDFNGDCGILEARSLISDCLKELSF